MSFDNIPDEIRKYNQWINWEWKQVNEKWTKIPVRTIDGRNASVNNPLDWTTFDKAVFIARLHNVGLGFVFTKSDPFVGFDLDDPEGNAQLITKQQEYLQAMNSYTEFSPSGKGLHIISKGYLPDAGKHPKGFGIFDNQRFFTFTGNVYYNAPIEMRAAEILRIYNEFNTNAIKIIEGEGQATETLTDTEVFYHACEASNGEKFKRLWNGDWKSDGYPSQSEADFALVNIISFYSRHASQAIRMFRSSKLGERLKAQKGNYLPNMVKRSFDRMPKQVTLIPNSEIWFDAASYEPWRPKLTIQNAGEIDEAVWHPLNGNTNHSDAIAAIVKSEINASFSKQIEYNISDPGRPLDFADPVPPMQIPGLVGELVAHTWNAAVHQVAEAAIASALSTMSLFCSRSYRHGSMGLSLYLLLLAQTSTGKSFAYSANDTRFNAMINRYLSFAPPKHGAGKLRADTLKAMVMGEMGSAQGLAQQMPVSPSTLAQLDEYVDHIRLMASPNPPAHLSQIRAELLKLMEMSGPGRIYRARKYSKRSTNGTNDDSVDVISASLSILATGTTEQFYDELSATLLTTGFLPRFTILEYSGGLTKRNSNIQNTVSDTLLNNLCFLFDRYVNLNDTLVGAAGEFIDVQAADKEAADYLEWFDNVCYREVQTANENRTYMAGMWSRAKENVRKIACLIAIGCNPVAPRITSECVGIAINIVRPSIDKIQAKIVGGEIGTNDDRLEAEVKRVIKKMMLRGFPAFKGYAAAKEEFFLAGIYPQSIIRNCCMHLAPFKTHKLGSSRAFDNTMRDMINYGIVKAVDANGMKCVKPAPEHFLY